MTQFEQLDLLLNEYGGIIQTFQVIDNGISKPVFYSYVKERGLEQAAHGVYVSPDTWTDAMYICIYVVVRLCFLMKLHCFPRFNRQRAFEIYYNCKNRV